MKHLKWFIPFILLFAIFLLLTGCGSSLQKPTGLEDEENHEQAEPSEETKRLDREDSLQLTEDDEDDKKDTEEASTEETEEESSTDSSSSAESKNETSSKEKKESNKQDESSDSKKEQPKESSSTKKDSSQKETTSEKKKDPPKEKEKKKSPPKEKKESPPKKEEKKDPPPKEEKPKEPKNTITMSFTGPSGKIVMAPEEFSIKEGANLFDATKEVAKQKGIPIETTGSGAWGYVQALGEFREFDYGQESGWLFRVNGTFSNAGAGSYTLQEGDVVEWLYTKDLGKDVGARP